MDKDVHDVIIIDEQGNDITSEVPGESYQINEILEVSYFKVARVKIKKEECLQA